MSNINFVKRLMKVRRARGNRTPEKIKGGRGNAGGWRERGGRGGGEREEGKEVERENTGKRCRGRIGEISGGEREEGKGMEESE